MSPRDRLNQLHREMTAWRRDLHAHPEIDFEEHRTSEIVAAKLAEWGIEVHRGLGGTPVHNPGYDFNDDLLPIGASYLAGMVEQQLG